MDYSAQLQTPVTARFLASRLGALVIVACVLAGCVSCRRAVRKSNNEQVLTVAEVKALPGTLHSARRVHIQGILTLADDVNGYIVVQDQTGGIRVRLAGEMNVELVKRRVDVTGTATIEGEDSIIEADMHDVGPGDYPAAPLLSSQNLSSTAFDYQWAKVTGILGPVRVEPTGDGVTELRRSDHKVTVRVVGADIGPVSSLVGSEVEVGGVVTTNLGLDGAVTSIAITAQSVESFRMLKSAPDSNSLQLLRVADVLAIRSHVPSQRIRLAGEVHAASDGMRLELRDQTGSLPIAVASGFTNPHSTVMLSGFVDNVQGNPMLADATVLSSVSDSKADALQSEPDAPVITQAQQVRNLTYAQARSARRRSTHGYRDVLASRVSRLVRSG